jgi:pyridoxamine 5'-phosphate oxidase
MDSHLPDPLPANPLALLDDWLAEARTAAAQPNPNSMVLATVDGHGQPSARVVLCKEIAAERGFIAFFTNYHSQKGRELAANPRAAVVFHWDHAHRQVRAEGRVERLPDADNDAYFRTRPWQARLGAWASRQSEPVESREVLVRRVAAAAQRFGIPYGGPGTAEPAGDFDLPRPPNWGGYRLHVEAAELWVEGRYRIHERVRYSRTTPPGVAGPIGWSAVRLQP